jgi:hypothetical protein
MKKKETRVRLTVRVPRIVRKALEIVNEQEGVKFNPLIEQGLIRFLREKYADVLKAHKIEL